MRGITIDRALNKVIIITIIMSCLFAAKATQAAGKREKYFDKKAGMSVEIEPDRIVLKLKKGTTAKAVSALLGKYKIKKQKGLLGDKYIVITVPAGSSASHAVDVISKEGIVEAAEPDFVAGSELTPSDPYYSQQWGLAKISAESAWDIATGSPDVVVAVVDTGVQANHPDLAGRVLAGRDFVNNDLDASDDQGHGTFISGIIAASANNGVGVAGICWNCKILPLKVLGSDGTGSYTNIAQAIIYAADNGVKIINLSLGGYSYSSILQDAVAYAYGKGALLVAAAGNGGGSSPMYPAAYSEVIAVAATDQNDGHYSTSNYGSDVELSAPGANIYSATLGGGWKYSSGTSASTAFVSGSAALLLSKYGTSATNQSLRSTLTKTAVDLGDPGRDQYFGYGRVDLYASMRSAAQITDVAITRFSVVESSGFTPGATFVVEAVVKNIGQTPASGAIIHISMDGAVQYSTALYTLAPGQEWTQRFTLSVPQKNAGEYFAVGGNVDLSGDEFTGNNENAINIQVDTVSNNQASDQTNKPAAPTSFKATAGNKQVYLEWWAPTKDENGNNLPSNITLTYHIYRNSSQYTTTTDRYYYDYGVVNATTYSYKVCATRSDSLEMACVFTDSVNATPYYPKPMPPAMYPAVGKDKSVYLSWSPPAFNTDNSLLYSTEISGYSIFRRTAGTSYDQLNYYGITVTNYTDETVTNGITYEYAVTVLANTKLSDKSASVFAKPDKPTPVAPAFTTVKAGDGKVELTWNTPTYNTDGTLLVSNDIAGYILYRNDTGPNDTYYRVDVLTLLTTTSITDQNLTNDKTYYYKVSAVAKNGYESARSAVSPAKPIYPTPNKPTSLTKQSGQTFIKLLWVAPAFNTDNTIVKDLAGYNVYRKAAGGTNIVKLNSSAVVTLTEYTDSTVVSNVSYNYYVTAVGRGSKESAPSDTIPAKAVTPVMAVENFRIDTPLDYGTLILRWKNPSSADFNHVEVYQTSGNDLCPSNIQGNINVCPNLSNTLGQDVVCTITGLADSTNYHFVAWSYGTAADSTPGTTACESKMTIGFITMGVGELLNAQTVTSKQPRVYRITPITQVASHLQAQIETTDRNDKICIGNVLGVYPTCSTTHYGNYLYVNADNITLGEEYYVQVSTTGTSSSYNIFSQLVFTNYSQPRPPTLTLSESPIGVQLSWLSYSNLERYNVYLKVSNVGLIRICSTESTSCVDSTGLKRDGKTQYCYVVTATNGMSGLTSDPNAADSNRCIIPKDTLPPEKVTQITASPYGAGAGINLAWKASDDTSLDLSGYEILRTDSEGGVFAAIDSVPSTVVAYQDKADNPKNAGKLIKNNKYYYKVRPYDDNNNTNNGPDEVVASAVLGGDDLSAPMKPGGLTATAADKTVNLTWNKNPEFDLSGYSVYISGTVAGTYYKLPASAYPRLNNRVVLNLSNGVQYCFKVSAYDNTAPKQNESELSDTVCATPNVPAIVIVDAGPINKYYSDFNPPNYDVPLGEIYPEENDASISVAQIRVQLKGQIDSLGIRIKNEQTGNVMLYNKLTNIPKPDSSGAAHEVVLEWNGHDSISSGNVVPDGNYAVSIVPNDKEADAVNSIGAPMPELATVADDASAQAKIGTPVRFAKKSKRNTGANIVDIYNIEMNCNGAQIANDGFTTFCPKMSFVARTGTPEIPHKLNWYVQRCLANNCDKTVPGAFESKGPTVSGAGDLFNYGLSTPGTYRIIARNVNSTETDCKGPNDPAAKDVCVFVNVFSVYTPNLWWFGAGVNPVDAGYKISDSIFIYGLPVNGTIELRRIGADNIDVGAPGQNVYVLPSGANSATIYSKHASAQANVYTADTGVEIRFAGNIIFNSWFAVLRPYNVEVNNDLAFANSPDGYQDNPFRTYRGQPVVGYDSIAILNVFDQFQRTIPYPLSVTEDYDDDGAVACVNMTFYAGVVNPNWNNNCTRQEACWITGGGVCNATQRSTLYNFKNYQFYDYLALAATQGYLNPAVQYPTPGALTTNRIAHFLGAFKAGSVTIGQGACMLRFEWVWYLDHARHEIYSDTGGNGCADH